MDEVQEVADAFVFSAWAQTYEFLGESCDGLAFAVDHKTDRAVETHADEVVDAGGHGGGEEHSLSGLRNGG